LALPLPLEVEATGAGSSIGISSYAEDSVRVAEVTWVAVISVVIVVVTGSSIVSSLESRGTSSSGIRGCWATRYI